MRHRMAALVGAAIVMAVSAAPALAQSTQFTCKGTYTVTENGILRSRSTNTFTAGYDMSGGLYSRTYTFWGRTYTATSTFDCDPERATHDQCARRPRTGHLRRWRTDASRFGHAFGSKYSRPTAGVSLSMSLGFAHRRMLMHIPSVARWTVRPARFGVLLALIAGFVRRRAAARGAGASTERVSGRQRARPAGRRTCRRYLRRRPRPRRALYLARRGDAGQRDARRACHPTAAGAVSPDHPGRGRRPEPDRRPGPGGQDYDHRHQRRRPQLARPSTRPA